MGDFVYQKNQTIKGMFMKKNYVYRLGKLPPNLIKNEVIQNGEGVTSVASFPVPKPKSLTDRLSRSCHQTNSGSFPLWVQSIEILPPGVCLGLSRNHFIQTVASDFPVGKSDKTQNF